MRYISIDVFNAFTLFQMDLTNLDFHLVYLLTVTSVPDRASVIE